MEVREQLGLRLANDARRPVEISRAFLALSNFNLLQHVQDGRAVYAQVQNMGARELSSLSSSCTLALRECKYCIYMCPLHMDLNRNTTSGFIGQTRGGGSGSRSARSAGGSSTCTTQRLRAVAEQVCCQCRSMSRASLLMLTAQEKQRDGSLCVLTKSALQHRQTFGVTACKKTKHLPVSYLFSRPLSCAALE